MLPDSNLNQFIESLKTTIRYLVNDKDCDKFNEIKNLVDNNRWGYLNDINWNNEDTSEIDTMVDTVLAKYGVFYR